jgi:tartrate dehydrogenase/decarboxylase/D-malate dehydrogenase
VADHVSLWGMLIPIRREFDQYINQRPARLLPGIDGPLAGVSAAHIDMIVVRENVEGEYSRIGGRLYQGTDAEIAVQESVFTRRGVGRVMDYAFSLAADRKKDLTSATKSSLAQASPSTVATHPSSSEAPSTAPAPPTAVLLSSARR